MINRRMFAGKRRHKRCDTIGVGMGDKVNDVVGENALLPSLRHMGVFFEKS